MEKVRAFLQGLNSKSVRLASPLWAAALDFVYPPECLSCGTELGCADCAFCEDCRNKLKPRFAEECPRCGAPVGQFTDLTDGCGQCRQEKFAFDRVVRLGIYEGEMRLACLRAKARGGNSIARGLAATLIQEKRELFNSLSIDLVIPIPEHWTRRFLHSHYAAETLSREVADRLPARWGRNVLSKLRRTPKQATSPTPLRRTQQQGSFGVSRPDQVSGKNVLLVDDILTTGSTASAAARTLKKCGANQVIVAVVAVSPLLK